MKTKIMDIPKDVNDIVLDEQVRIKKEKNVRQYSFDSTIFKIIREWKKLVNTKEKNK